MLVGGRRGGGWDGEVASREGGGGARGFGGAWYYCVQVGLSC